MLQTLPRSGAGPTDATDQTARTSPADIFAFLTSIVRRQLRIVLLVALLTFALGMAYLIATPPGFTAKAILVLDARRTQLLSQQTPTAETGWDPARVETQVEIVKSEAVILSVIKDLHLTDDPEFTGGGTGLIATIIGPIASLLDPDTPKSELELTRTSAAAFARRLTVRRMGLSYILDVQFVSRDPKRAAQIANAVADAYIVDQLEAKYQATRRASVWLLERIGELRDQTSTAQQAVVEFKAKNDIVDTGGRSMNEQQLTEINTQLVTARNESAEAKAKLDRIETVLRTASPDETVDATVGDTLKNEVITRLRSQYLELARRANDWTVRYGQNHLAVVQARNQMQEVRSSILDELRRIAETYKSDYDISKQRISAIQSQLAQAVSQSQTVGQAQVALRDLESRAQTYRTLYDSFLQRYMEAIQQQSFPITEARVITTASPPLHKSEPNTLLVLITSVAGGMFLGVAAGALRDRWNRVFRTSAEIEDILQVQCLAVLPRIEATDAKAVPAWRRATAIAAKPLPQQPAPTAGPAARPRTIRTDHDLLWHVAGAPLSSFSESMRSIKLAIDLNEAAKPTKTVGITSVLPNEGKSTIAASLAVLMSQADARVILVDCDLRNPSLTRSLAPQSTRGILEVLSGDASLDDVTWSDPSGKLAFLPGAVSRNLANTTEILLSQQAKALVDTLRNSYDYVVIDLSPLAPVVDVRATTQLIDAYIFIVEWGRTRVDMVERAIGAAELHDSLLGVVLNKAEGSGPDHYHYSGYSSGSHAEHRGEPGHRQ